MGNKGRCCFPLIADAPDMSKLVQTVLEPRGRLKYFFLPVIYPCRSMYYLYSDRGT